MSEVRMLICTRLNRTSEEEESAQEAYGYFSQRPGGVVIRDSELDWDQMRFERGSYEGAYEKAVDKHDILLMIEGDDGSGEYVSRGQYSLVQWALKKGKAVAAWRGGRAVRISSQRITGDDWKGEYGRLEE